MMRKDQADYTVMIRKSQKTGQVQMIFVTGVADFLQSFKT